MEVEGFMREQLSDNKDFIIQIKGLKIGKYEYGFLVDGAFFKRFGNTQVFDAAVDVRILLEKGSGWMNVVCEADGKLVVECDRCLEPMSLPVHGECSLSARLGEEDEDDGDLITVAENPGVLDLSWYLYEMVALGIPMRHVHPEGQCDAAIVEKLSGAGQEKPVDPRWAALEQLKTKTNNKE